MYKVKYSKGAIRKLRKLPKNRADRICLKINELAKSPYLNTQVKLLKGVEGYRLRVGDWRIIYTINDTELEIWIVKIASRGDIYS